MQTETVIRWFGGNQSAIARALGVGKAAVSKWKKTKVIPPLHAARLEKLTGGALKFDPEEYVSQRKEASDRRLNLHNSEIDGDGTARSRVG